MNPKTEEEKKRIEVFLKEYRELVEKYKVDFANFPVYQPTGNGDFKTIIQSTPVDLTKLSKPSPFIEK